MKTPIELRETVFIESLVPICVELKNSITNGENVNNKTARLKEYINKIFEEYNCSSIVLTNNTDNVLFGVKVNRTITDTELLEIILNDSPVSETFSTNYNMEIDLSVFNILSGFEVATYIVEEIASIMSSNTIEIVRSIIDCILTSEETSIEIRQSINYSQILTFGIKETFTKVASLIYKDKDAIGMNKYSESFDLKDTLRELAGIIKMNVFGEENTTANPNLSVLKWALMVYKDVPLYYNSAKELLENSKQFTGSVLEKREIDKTLQSIKKAYFEILGESVVEESVKGFSLFKSLKANGLRSIEDDLYEFKIRIKNCEDQEEAMYILRQINTRISILEDYLDNTEVSESEENRWRTVIHCFRELRVELSKLKITNKKSYGIFIDYNKLDQIYN